MAIALIQSVKKVVSGANNTTLAYGSDLTAGNLLCNTHAHWNSGALAITTPVDTLSHTYAAMTAEQGGAGALRLRSFYEESCTGGACTVTFDIATTDAGGDLTVVVAEFSGAALSAALDATQVGTGTGTAVDSGTTATLAQADEMIWGGMTHDGGNQTITETGGATLVQENEGGTGNVPIGCSYEIVAATTAQAATWTIGLSTLWFAHVATFKAAAAGGATSLVRGMRMTFVGVGR